MMSDVDGNKLWMGDLESFMDEAFLTSVFAQYGYHVPSIRLIRDYQTGLVARYCFVEFNDSNAARHALDALSGQPIPGTNGTKRFKLNWPNRKADSGQVDYYNVFVADISKDVTSHQLLDFFQQTYSSVRDAKVVEDENGASKGYGFVRFIDERERDLSLVEMDGAKGLGYKPLTVKPAQAPKSRASAILAPEGATVPAPMAGQLWQSPSILHVPYLPQPMMPRPFVPLVQPVGGYVEDLVDYGTVVDEDTTALCQQAEQLYLQLEACRWQVPPDTKVL